MHTLPLTTWLALCRADRMPAWTSILLEQNFGIVRCERMSGWLAVREAARQSVLLEQSGLVRQNERSAAEAMVPRLYVCVVPFVAWVARGRSARIREDTPPWRRFER